MGVDRLKQVQIDGVLVHTACGLGADGQDLDIVAVVILANDLQAWDNGG